MKKSLVKMMAVLLLAVMVVTATTNVFADGYNGIIAELNKGDDKSGAKDTVISVIGAILSIARAIGVGVAVIMLVVLAIKYISASPGDKAEIKKHAVVYVVGVAVLFGASGILTIIQIFVESNIKSP